MVCAGRGDGFRHGMDIRGQHAGDYHDSAVVAGHSLETALQRDLHCTAIGGLNHSVHPAQSGG